MTIEQLPSGSYRVRQMYNGKRYTITVPYKPSKKEAVQLLAQAMENVPKKTERMTFYRACEQYVEIKENVLSPRTVREYSFYKDRLPTWFTGMFLSDITQKEIQRCVNQLAEDKSPKTVRTLHGFISAVLSHFYPDLKIHTTLPQKVANEPYIPSNDEVKQLLDYTKENYPHFYVPIFLGGYSLRRSELLAALPSDIDENGFLHIDKAKVEDKNGNWVVKTTKTEKSARKIPLPPELIEMIREQGYVYNMAPQSISNYMRRTQKKLGMKKFSLHKMRHYCGSRLVEMGYSFKDVQEFCGWASDATPRQIYLHSLKAREDEEKKKISSALSKGLL